MTLFLFSVRLRGNGLLFLLLLLGVYRGSAQVLATGRLAGAVQTAANEPLPGATVRLVGTSQGTATDAQGQFELTDVPAGSQRVQVSALGFAPQEQTVTVVAGETLRLRFRLREGQQQLGEVQVTGQSETTQQRQSAIKAEVLDLRTVRAEAGTLTDVLSRAPGIRVRQLGGLGAAATVNINGFQGKAVKLFKDGIPLDYYGEGYSIALVPTNALARVDVYRGALPVRLGADALGGAVDLVTRPPGRARVLDVSYEAASFNTHRASANFALTDTASGRFVGFDGFYNHSDNNYRIQAPVLNFETARATTQTVRRFHDGFTSYFGEVYGGLRNWPWADELRLGLTYFRIDKDEQQGATTTARPWGEVRTAQFAWVPTVRYRLTRGRFSLDQFLTYSAVQAQRVDTCRCRYNWAGERQPALAVRGEALARGSLAEITFATAISRSYGAWQLNEHNRLETNVVFSNAGRRGSDPLGPRYDASGRDILAVPASYQKLVAGLSWETQLGTAQRLTNVLSGKLYAYRTNGTDAGAFNSFEETQVTSRGLRGGVAEAVKVQMSENAFVRLSAELATRLPEQGEVFGDGQFQLSNFELRPEQSLNLNLGYRLARPGGPELEANAFYRRTRNLILLVPYLDLFSQYQNQEQVRGAGADVDLRVPVRSWLTLGGNVNYQNLRLAGLKQTPNASENGARLSNTPWFYYNLSARARWASPLRTARPNDEVQAYYYFSYVHDYYLETIAPAQEPSSLFGRPGIDTQLIIPRQNLHTVGLTYNLGPDAKYALGVEVKNLLNAALYDNFRVQRAGRSIHLKLRALVF